MMHIFLFAVLKKNIVKYFILYEENKIIIIIIIILIELGAQTHIYFTTLDIE
jgi:hypothetical protein